MISCPIEIFNSPFAEIGCMYYCLKVFLERTPSEDDLRLVTRSKGDNSFHIFYKGERLGMVRLKYKVGQEDPYKASFTPFYILN